MGSCGLINYISTRSCKAWSINIKPQWFHLTYGVKMYMCAGVCTEEWLIHLTVFSDNCYDLWLAT